MYEGAYEYQHYSPPQAYHHQANQFQQYHEYSQPRRNFPTADYRNYKFHENKENKHGPESLAYYLTDRREPGYSSSRSPGEHRQSISPRNKPPYDKRGRAEYGRSSSYRSPRGHSYERKSKSFHSRSPQRRSSNSPRGSASRSSSRHRSSKYSSNRSWKRSREREKRQRSRSSSKSESATEGAVSERKISPKIKQRRDKYGSPEREDSHKKGIKRPVSSVCKIVNKKERYHFSKHQSINEKLKKEETIGLEMTIGELSMSPISSEDFSQRSGEAESDGEVEDCEKKAQKESKNESISIMERENHCLSTSNSISSNNQGQLMPKDDIEGVQAGEQNNVNILKSKQHVEKKGATKDRKVRKSSGDKIKHEKGYVNKNDTSDSDSKPKDSENKHKCKNSDITKEKSEEVSLNVEDDCTESNASAQKPSEEIKNLKVETSGKNEEDQNKNTSNIEKLEHTLIESNTKLNSKIMPREMVSKIMSLIESRGKNSEIPTECNKIQNEETDCQKDKKEKVGCREDKVKDRTNVLPKDESKSEGEEITEVTDLSESYTNNEKYHENRSNGSNEEIIKMLEDKNKVKLITKNQKGHLNSKEDKSVITRKDICQDQKKNKKTNDKFSREQVQIKSFHVENVSEIFAEDNCYKSTDKANENQKKSGTTDEANKKSTDAHKDFQNNCTNGQDLQCRSSPDCVGKNIHEGTIQKQSQSSVNCKQGQKSDITLQGSSKNQEKIISRNTKDKLKQTPTNLDQSHSHTLSLKDKRKCFEECIKAREKNESHSKSDSRKNEQTSKFSHTNSEQYKNKQEKKSVPDNIDGIKDQKKLKKLEDVPANIKERRHSGVAHELLNARVRKLSGPANLPQNVRERKHSGAFAESHNAVEGKLSSELDPSCAKSLSCGESSPAVVKGTMNRPTGDVFYPLGRASEKKRKLSPPNKAAESASDVTHNLENSKKSKLSIPIIEEQRVTVTEIKNKLEESSPSVKKTDHEESASGPKRSLFGKNKKRISHYTHIDNKQIARGQIQTTILGLSQRKSPSQNTKSNIFKKLTTKKVSGSPVKPQTHKHKLEKKTSVESSGTDTNQTREVRVSHSDNIFERIKESNDKEGEEDKTMSETIKAGVKRTHNENCKNTISDTKKRKHEGNNKVTSIQEKPLSIFKDKEMPERGFRHVSPDTKNKSERKSMGDEKTKIADSNKQSEIEKKTNSLATVNEMFGESSESKDGETGSDLCKSITTPRITESDKSKSGDSTATREMLIEYTKTNTYEKLIPIQSKYRKNSKSDESRFEEKRVYFGVSNTQSNETSKLVSNEADKDQSKESSKEVSNAADDRKKSKELCKEVSHEADNKVKSKESSKMVNIQSNEEKSKQPFKVISVEASHLEKSKESSKSEKEALCHEEIKKQANSEKFRNKKVETELTTFNDFKEPKTQVEVEKERGENARKKIKDFDSKADSADESKVLDKENELLKSTTKISNALDDIFESEKSKTYETEMESDTDDDNSDVGDIEPIEMIGSVFINDACMDELHENVMESNVEKTEMNSHVEKTEMDSNVENAETAIVKIKYCDDQIIVHDTDDRRKPLKGKEGTSDENDTNKLCQGKKVISDENNESQQTIETETKTKTTPRKRFAPQLETLGKMIEEEKELDEIEREKLETHMQKERKKKEVERGQSYESEDDDDSELISSGVEISPAKEKTSTTTSQWLEKAKKKLKVPECLIKAKDCIQTLDYERVVDIIPDIPEQCITFNKTIFEKGFNVSHTKQLKNGEFAQTNALFSPKKLYRTSSGEDKNLGKCLLCLSCSMYFTPLAFTVHHDTQSVVEQIDTERSKQQGYSLVEGGDADTMKMFKDFMYYFQAERRKQYGSSPVILPRTKTPTEQNCLVSEDKDLCVTLKGNGGATATPSASNMPQVEQSRTKFPKNSAKGVVSPPVCKGSVHLQPQMHPTSLDQMKQTNQTSELVSAQVNQIDGEQQKQMQLAVNLQNISLTSEQPAKSHVPQAQGDQFRQACQTSQQQNPNDMNLMLAGHSKLTADQQHRKTSQTAKQHLALQVNKAVGQQRAVKQSKKNKRQKQGTKLQYILPNGSQNQQEQIPQVAGQQLLSQVECAGPQTSRAQVRQTNPQEYYIPGSKTSQQIKQNQNTSVPIKVLPKQSIPNNCQRGQLCYSSFPGFQQSVSHNVMSTKNIGTVPMFNPLTALYMNQPVHSENRAVNTSDYTGIPVAAPSSVIIPSSSQVTQQGPGQTLDKTVYSFNYTLTLENMGMPGVREPARAGSSAQSAQPVLKQGAYPEKERVSRQVSNEVETVVNAGTVEEKRRNLLKQLLELDNIHTGDSGLDLILFGRKYVSRGLASVNQDVLRLYRERTANTAVQPQLPQRNGKPMSVEERAYYMGQLRRSQHQ